MKKTRIIVPSCAFVALLVAAFALPAFASSTNFEKDLPAYQSNVTVVGGSKDGGGSYNAYVQVNSDVYGGNFWVDQYSVGSRATDTSQIAPGSGATLAYYSSSWTGSAFLRGCQLYWGPGVDHTSGWVNFDA